MNQPRCQILLTNDDGIESPGLWAAAQALSKLGFVTVAAPRDQASGTGRSLPITSDGRITLRKLQIGSQEWQAYAVGGTPAQVVLHALHELLPERPDLVVSGINYGENIGEGITVSGTVGAAMEAAGNFIPALAMSLQIDPQEDYYGYSRRVDFSAAAYFTEYFARQILEKKLPPDVDLLKVDVPDGATQQTPWKITRISRQRYFEPYVIRQGSLEEPGMISATIQPDEKKLEPDGDIRAVIFDRVVSVTPVSLDMTARVDFEEMRRLLGG